MTDQRKLLSIRAALVAGGVLLLAPPWKEWLVQMQLPPVWSESIGGLLKGIGEASIVALVLELLVDARLKRRVVQETIREVAPRILAHLLPEQIFRYIEEQLLQANLVRRNWNITYWITPLANPQDYVKLETESKYEMANVAPSPATYGAVYEVELGSFATVGQTDITEVTVRSLLLPAGANVVFQYPGCAPQDAPAKVGDYMTFRKSFEIPVHKTHSAMQFVFRSTEYFHVGSIVPFFAKYLVELTTLRVIYPINSLKVIVDFPANKDSELQPGKAPCGDDSYVFPKPILPGQGFTVRFPVR